MDKQLSYEELKKKKEELEKLLKEKEQDLLEAQETLEAIRNGSIDALVRHSPKGNQIFMLKGSEQPYRNLIEEMKEGAILISDNGTILYGNTGFATLIDAPLDTIMGKNIKDWISQGSIETFQELLSNSNKETTKQVYEIAFQTTKHQTIPTQVSINKIAMESFNATALIVTDLTKHMEEDVKRYTSNLETEIAQRKKAQEALKASEEQFRKAIEEAPIPIIMHAEDGKVLQISRTWSELTGYTLNDVNTFDEWLTKAVYGEGTNQIRDHIHELFKGNKRSIDVEFSVRTIDGKVRYWSFSASSPGVLSDGRRYIVGMAVDITERKQAEKKLEQYSKDLEILVNKRTKQLREAERMAAIGATAGMVGHDLRNPLQSIAGNTYLMKLDVESLPESEVKESMRESLGSIIEQVSYMDKIVSDLQAFVKPVEVNKQTVNLNELILSTLTQTYVPKNIHVDTHIIPELEINIDPQLLKRVLINLFTNSIQAMPNGGELNVEADVNDKGYVQIIVQDTGVGIPEEIRPKLFTPLFTTKSKGQGFGLAVCKRVLEAQGGTITFESEIGKGTKFIVNLPTKK